LRRVPPRKSRITDKSSRLTLEKRIMLLTLKNTTIHYGKAEAIKNVNLEVAEGSITGLIGANGAGKSTILRAISGLLPLTSGEVWFQQKRVDGMLPHDIVRRGIAQVPEGRRLFPYMSVLGNIRIGAYLRSDKRSVNDDMERVFQRFPILQARQNQRADTLSGGEQQMLAIARALMTRPKLLLMDEPSWGLAPLVVTELARIIRDIHKEGITVLLVEQNAAMTSRLTNYVYVLEVGKVVMEGEIRGIMANEAVRKAFLG
jgi:branched-chain amino acid transport system ATP-binding protein